MTRYICKRLLFMILVLLGVAFIVFSIMSLVPGDPARVILGDNATQEQLDMLNAQLGTDQPFLARFGSYIWNMVTKLDFGTSYSSRRPVFDEIATRFPYTLKLAILGVFFSSLIGIFVGVFSAIKQYSPFDTISTILALFFASVPGFWFGMMLILFFSLHLKLLPSNGLDSLIHYILPTLAISIPYSAGILRLTRSTMLETVRQDYIRTARAKGVTEWVIIWKHAFRNALLPVITQLGNVFGQLLGGSVVIETVFAIPGLGSHIVSAIRMKDTPVVMASVMLMAFFFCLVILAVDLLYAFIDPRIKAKYARR